MKQTGIRLMALMMMLALLLPLAGLAQASAENLVPVPIDDNSDDYVPLGDVVTVDDTTPAPTASTAPTASPTQAPIVVPAPAEAAQEAEPAAETAEGPAAAVPAAPEGFEFLKAAAASVNKYYTAIRIPGYEHTVYAFTDKDGKTQFRVYGRLNKKRGMFETTVTTAGDGSEALVVAVTGEKPVVERNANFAKGKSVQLDDTTKLEGYRTTTKRGVLYFTNLFKQKEYRVLGEIPGVANAYYPAVNGRPRLGSLAIDVEADQERFKQEDEKYYKVPKEYRKGFAIQVFIFTTDGQKVTVLTDKPVLDRETLK